MLTCYFNSNKVKNEEKGIKQTIRTIKLLQGEIKVKKQIKWKYNPMYYIFVLCYYVLLYYISYLICNALGDNTKFHLFSNAYYLLNTSILTLFLGGPLGEELGWRGFLLPRLQRKLKPLYASLIIGIVWACWHLPLFFIPGTSQHGSSFYLFLLMVTCYAIQFTWVYNRTNGSLIFPILFHTSINVSSGLIYKYTNVYICTAIIVNFIIMIIFYMSNKKQTYISERTCKVNESNDN